MKAVLTLLLTLALLPGGVTAAQEPAGQELSTPTFSVQTQLVQIYCTVTQGSRRVTDLAPSDFVLEEDGRTQAIDRLDTGTVPLQIVLMLDTSGSMREAMALTQEAAAYFVESLRPGDRITLVLFNTDIQAFTQVTEDRSPILQAIRGAQARGGTKLYEALLFAMKHLSGKEGRKALVCFSDGEDTARTSSLNVVLNAAARYGYPIYAVGAGAGLERSALKTILRQLSEVNSGRAYFVEDPRRLRGTFGEISAELRSAYVLNYYTGVPFNGRWHDLKVAACNPQHRVQARKGFYARAGGNTSAFAGQADPAPPMPSGLQFSEAGELREEHARNAARQIEETPMPVRELDAGALQAALPAAAGKEAKKEAVYKVESRFVEVPVLIESPMGRELPALSEKDFRIYEDDTLQQIAYFSQDVTTENIEKVRDAALKKVQAGSRGGPAASPYKDNKSLMLGRYYLVLDDMMTDMDALAQAKLAAEKILRQYHRPMRPFSVHLTREGAATVLSDENLEGMLRRVRGAMSRAPTELMTNDNVMSVYEAFLIDRGDRDAAALAELRLASESSLAYQNELGSVSGPTDADPNLIRTTVQTMGRHLISLNHVQVAHLLDGLQAVIRAAAVDPGSHPKMILFFSTGFALGHGAGRSDLGDALNRIVADARRSGVRVFTIDAGQLSSRPALSMRARGSFLVNNPHLQIILEDHMRAWKFDCESPLNLLAKETNGRFIHSTNDLVGAAQAAIRSAGLLYYLGYLSSRPADGRFHRIRITTPLTTARVHAREGYVAAIGGPEAEVLDKDLAGEDWETVIAGAQEAQNKGDFPALASSLEKLVRRFPGQATLWYNLGVARLKLENPAHAVEALQRALMLAPGDKGVGLTLSRALVASGQRAAAAETMQFLVHRHPRDIDLLVHMGLVYEAQSLPFQAYGIYRRVLDVTLQPPLPVYILLTRTSVALGRKAEAGVFIRDYLGRGGEKDAIRQWSSQAGLSPRP